MKEIQLFKYILGIVLIFLTLQTQAQVSVGGTATYRLELSLTQNRGFSNCDGGGGIYFMSLKGNTDIEMYNGPRFQFPGETETFTEEFNSPNAFDYIQIDAASKRDGTLQCRSSEHHRDRRIQLNRRTCYTTFGNLSFQHADDFSYEAKVFPVVSINQPNNSAYLANDEFLTITLPDNIDPSYYNWEYSIRDGQVDGPFLPFPPTANGRVTNNIARLRIRGDEFLTDNEFGKIINIRVNPKCNISAPSNTISLEYLKSVPRIINATSSNVSCYDAIDGSVYLTFDGPLDPNLNGINISIEDFSRPDGVDANGVPKYDVIMTVNNVRTFDINNGILIEGISPSNPPTANNTRIRLFGEGYYTDASGHTANVNIGRPDFVSFNIINTIPIWCRGGEDGEIMLQASGGTNNGYQYTYKLEGEMKADDWKPFSNSTTHSIKNLPPGKYEVKVRDANQCLAKIPFTDIDGIIQLGNPLIQKTEITQPNAALQVTTQILNQPTAFGFEDGRILAVIKGGTSHPDNTYDYEWRDADNNIITTTTESFDADNNYVVMLHSIGKGDYKIIIKDANYDSATNKEGCTTTSDTYSLDEPEPIQITIDIHTPISCHIENEYSNGIDFNSPLGIPDQFQDGALIATVTGGVPFDNTIAEADECRANFKPYCYNWKKRVGNTWVDIPTNDNIISNQSVGTYALNVEDKNGIVLGTYEEYIAIDGSREYRLVQTTDATKYLPQPDKLEIAFTNTVVTCLNGNDAEATAIVTGGTPPYNYEWSNGQNTPTINNLIGGTYLVFVTDAKGCRIEGSVKIEQPNGLEILPTSVVSPTCFEGNDGLIEVDISGGNPPYTYIWNTGSTTTGINGLSAGTYRIEVVDSKGCKAFFEKTLIDPEPIVVDMEQERSLCNGQSLQLDIAIDDPGAVYSWSSDNGFTSSDSAVEITNAGQYTATITSSLGCMGVGEIEVKVFDTPIDADFLITTQAYNDQEVILVNVSDPMGETIEWTIPEDVEVISESDEKLVLKFDEAGPYDINLRSNQGDCYQDFTKTVLVQPAIEAPEVFASQGEFIEEFIVYPNPNGGTFKTKITLAENANISLKIINLMSGATMHERSEKNNQDFLLDYSLSLPTGVYLLLLETPKGTETRKLVFE